jgi:hypothetical protein
MRWFFLIVISLWIFIATIAPIIALCVTRNLLCISGFTTLAPPAYILYRITVYLFPKDDRDYKLAEIKVLHGTTNSKSRSLDGLK